MAAPLRMLDAATGSARWSTELGSPAVWAGYLEDKLIAADGRQVVALDLASGTVLWRYQPGAGGKDANRPDPFAAAERRSDGRPSAAAGPSMVSGWSRAASSACAARAS